MPRNVTGVIQAPTNTVLLLGRTLVNGPADLQNAVALTTRYQLIPLSSYGEFLRTGNYTPPTNVPVTPPNPDFVALPPANAPGFAMPELFDVLAKYSFENPPPAHQLGEAAALVLSGLINQNQLISSVVTQATAAMAQYLASTATRENGWAFNLNIGSYGTDYLLRAAIAKFGFGANIAADAV
jgi:hypothetical protein